MTVLKRLFSPLLVLVIGLLATIAASLIVGRTEEERREERFAALADGVASTIRDELEDQRLVLRGLAAFFHASEEIGPIEFRDYVNRLRLPQNHPGTLGIGFSLAIRNEAEWRQTRERMRAAGVTNFQPWPEPKSFPASTIILIEPASPANRRALGFNMFGEPSRRAAMTRAKATGVASMSAKVQLVQDRRSGPNPGFLIYVPVGREAGARPGTAAERNGGWAYSPLRAEDIIKAALARPEFEKARIRLFDGEANAANLLYESADLGAGDHLTTERTIDFGGRHWLLQVSPADGFFADEPLSLGWAVAIGGLLLTLLLAALAAQQSLARARTEQEVRRATAELRRTNSELIETSRAREEAEAQLRQSQKLEAIGQLTGGIAHDFNNMLAVVIGNLDMATRRRDDPERLSRALSHAQEGARRAAELTQRLLAFGRQQPLVPRLLDPNRLVRGMSELLRRTLGEQVRLETVLAGELWPVEADAGQLENALLNLAINARDAMPGGGTLTIRTSNRQLDQAYAAGHEDAAAGDYVSIAVTDTGTGMPPDVAARAFDPFFTTKEVGKGTGLGLSMVFGFVRQSGGHLNIDSAPGKGTTMTLFLPRAHGAVVGDEPTAEPNALPRGTADEIIIVAEDQEDVRTTTVENLRELGYTVVHAAGGTEALEALARHGGASLLLTDIVMPGMSGPELARVARQQFPGLRIVYTTGYAPDNMADDGRLDPDVPMLPKPFTLAQLATCIRQALDG